MTRNSRVMTTKASFPSVSNATEVAPRRKSGKEGKGGGKDNAERDEMQRRRPVAAAEEVVHNQGEVVNLLNTDLRDECKPAPSAERLKNFVRENYTLERMVPISR